MCESHTLIRALWAGTLIRPFYGADLVNDARKSP